MKKVSKHGVASGLVLGAASAAWGCGGDPSTWEQAREEGTAGEVQQAVQSSNWLTATSAAGLNTVTADSWLGTDASSNYAVELRVRGQRALRLEPVADITLTPNVIGGHVNNQAKSGIHASVIAGGGEKSGGQNRLTDSYTTIAGGASNVAGNDNASVSDAPGATISGGNNHRASGGWSTVGGGYTNKASGEGAAVNGGTYNVASGGMSAVGGGGAALASGVYSTVGGGFTNASKGQYSTVAGGANCLANDDYTVVGGGQENTALGGWSVVGGGHNNRAGDLEPYGWTFATVSGGEDNVAATTYSTVAGGNKNSATMDHATVSGGYFNTASNTGAAVAGGYLNVASGAYSFVSGRSNVASGAWSFAGGGLTNEASGHYSAVLGGSENGATGERSVVVGGFHNRAIGNDSFAAGKNAYATYNNCFVWSDGSNTTACDAAEQFHVRARAGVYFYSSTGFQGVKLLPGSGMFQEISDRNAKTDIVAVDVLDVLKRVTRLPMTTWSYKTEQGIRHMGPMAQDFRAAFGLATDDRSIGTLDASGVALTAIQGLDKKLRAIETESASLKEGLTKATARYREELASLTAQIVSLLSAIRHRH